MAPFGGYDIDSYSNLVAGCSLEGTDAGGGRKTTRAVVLLIISGVTRRPM